MSTTNTIIQGNCIEIMKTMAPESVDFILTDPPYALRHLVPKPGR